MSFWDSLLKFSEASLSRTKLKNVNRKRLQMIRIVLKFKQEYTSTADNDLILIIWLKYLYQWHESMAFIKWHKLFTKTSIKQWPIDHIRICHSANTHRHNFPIPLNDGVPLHPVKYGIRL